MQGGGELWLARRAVVQFAHVLQQAQLRAGVRNGHPFVAEQEFGDGPTHAFLAHAIGNRYPHVIEKQGVGVMDAIDGDDRFDGNAGRAHIDQ